MSSLRNQIIKLAYLNPDLRGDLLPLIIKKYAGVSAGSFDEPAKLICAERDLPEDKNLQAVSESLKKAFEGVLSSVIQGNLAKENFVPSSHISIVLDFKKGVEKSTLYINQKENSEDFDISEKAENPESDEIEYDVPKGFTGSFSLVLDLSGSDEEIIKKYRTLKEKLDEKGNPVRDEEGNPVLEEAKSSVSPSEARREYIKKLNTDTGWMSDLNDALGDRLEPQKQFLAEKIMGIANAPSGPATAIIPPTLSHKVRPNCSVADPKQLNFTCTAKKPLPDGQIEFLVTFGGPLKWEVVIQ